MSLPLPPQVSLETHGAYDVQLLSYSIPLVTAAPERAYAAAPALSLSPTALSPTAAATKYANYGFFPERSGAYESPVRRKDTNSQTERLLLQILQSVEGLRTSVEVHITAVHK